MTYSAAACVFTVLVVIALTVATIGDNGNNNESLCLCQSHYNKQGRMQGDI